MSGFSKLSDSEKIRFSEEFLDRFLTHGFGTMPKREIEILIFHLLYHKTDLFFGQSNYDISNELKISESKVKSFKSEASLKYQQIFHQDALKEIAKLFFEYNKSKTTLDGDMVQFAMEDPVLKREFEYAVKKLGYYVDHSFNREIVKVNASVFLEVFMHEFDEVEEKFLEVAKIQYKNDTELQKLLSKEQPYSKQIELILGEHKNKIDLLITFLSKLLPMVN